MKGSCYDILGGSLGPESIMVRAQAGLDVVFVMLENQFLKALYQDGVECHMAEVK